MTNYTVRRATLADADALVRHRIRMFEDMGVMSTPDPNDAPVAGAFRRWLADLMPTGSYVAWVVDAPDASGSRVIVAGGGATLIPWPPGPRYPGTRLAFVYNVYTEPEHRGRGLARMVMDAIHAFCRDEGIDSLALNASTFGQPLYESIGYRVTHSPMMFLSLR
ncbi:MAG TPA: GNAT family N-acetyltransferase [Vicinamibacterales bacterium]|nr:GNAT family N-acetyltransferase [Vicinamibacterales bacterium]